MQTQSTIKLPSEQFQADLERALWEHYRETGEKLDLTDAEMSMLVLDGDYHTVIQFEGCDAWIIRWDDNAQAIMKAVTATLH